MTKTYQVPVRWVYEGTFTVEAQSEADALRKTFGIDPAGKITLLGLQEYRVTGRPTPLEAAESKVPLA